ADPELFRYYNDIVKEPLNALDIAKEGGGTLLDKVSRSAFFREITEAGNVFEAKILGELLDKTSPTYKKLEELVPDLSERKVLSQVQFCIPGKSTPCNEAGEYFIADFVFVKYDSRNRINDIIVADSKLSQNTNLTGGQELAQKGIGNNLVIRSTIISQDANKVDLVTPLQSGASVKNSAFYKVYGDGKGNFSGIE
ncbi:MAG TPA: hypothetical protein DCR93_03785, partial [Cytophagales bacterium]|nr:hypothetical protein [Cytophagales bacterium]